MAEKLKTASVSQLLDLIDEVFPSISTSFNLADILEMAPQMQNYQLVDTQAIPLTNTPALTAAREAWLFPVPWRAMCENSTNSSLSRSCTHLPQN